MRAPWSVRMDELSVPDIRWDELEQKLESLEMYEKLLLFGRQDCPVWLLLHMFYLPPQLCLAGESDINVPLRNAARRRLQKLGKLPAADE